MEAVEKPTINLLVTLDQNYLEPLKTMLISFGRQHTDCPTALYIAHTSLSERDVHDVEQAVAAFPIAVHSVRITERYFRDTPVLARIPEESFYRLLAFRYLPDSVERCLYLDPDILVRKSLLPLYTMDFQGGCIVAAGHLHGLNNTFNKARLGLREQERYINSGVMLMNLTEIRRRFTLERILTCLEENIQALIMGDQDMVNLLFGSSTVFVDERIYNLDERAFDYHRRHHGLTLEQVASETAILHYNGKYKPWLEGYQGVLNRFYPEVGEKGPAPHGMIPKQIKSIYDIARPTGRQKSAKRSGARQSPEHDKT